MSKPINIVRQPLKSVDLVKETFPYVKWEIWVDESGNAWMDSEIHNISIRFCKDGVIQIGTLIKKIVDGCIYHDVKTMKSIKETLAFLKDWICKDTTSINSEPDKSRQGKHKAKRLYQKGAGRKVPTFTSDQIITGYGPLKERPHGKKFLSKGNRSASCFIA